MHLLAHSAAFFSTVSVIPAVTHHSCGQVFWQTPVPPPGLFLPRLALTLPRTVKNMQKSTLPPRLLSLPFLIEQAEGKKRGGSYLKWRYGARINQYKKKMDGKSTELHFGSFLTYFWARRRNASSVKTRRQNWALSDAEINAGVIPDISNRDITVWMGGRKEVGAARLTNLYSALRPPTLPDTRSSYIRDEGGRSGSVCQRAGQGCAVPSGERKKKK